MFAQQHDAWETDSCSSAYFCPPTLTKNNNNNTINNSNSSSSMFVACRAMHTSCQSMPATESEQICAALGSPHAYAWYDVSQTARRKKKMPKSKSILGRARTPSLTDVADITPVAPTVRATRHNTQIAATVEEAVALLRAADETGGVLMWLWRGGGKLGTYHPYPRSYSELLTAKLLRSPPGGAGRPPITVSSWSSLLKTPSHPLALHRYRIGIAHDGGMAQTCAAREDRAGSFRRVLVAHVRWVCRPHQGPGAAATSDTTYAADDTWALEEAFSLRRSGCTILSDDDNDDNNKLVHFGCSNAPDGFAPPRGWGCAATEGSAADALYGVNDGVVRQFCPARDGCDEVTRYGPNLTVVGAEAE
eukprot:PhM_4_TR14605/c0_g1_i1/m.87784